MKALVIRRYGNNGVVHLENAPEPALRPRDVLIEVHAAGVNPVDFKIRAGKLKAIRKFTFPLILGCDVSGIVRKVGAQATRFKEGDAVFARLEKDRMGAFAEYVAADQSVVAKKPKRVDHVHAAALPLVALTSWQALAEEAKLQKGQKVLIHAGAGGIGSVAIPIAKHLGATIATTTSAKNVDYVKSLGANVVVDYTKDDFTRVLSDYDAVFETLGGASEIRSAKVLKKGGVMVGIAGLPTPDWARANGAGGATVAALTVLTFLRERAVAARGARYVFLFMRPDGALLSELGDLVEEGKLAVSVDKVFPLDFGTEALAYVEAGHARGKVVIQVKASRGAPIIQV